MAEFDRMERMFDSFRHNAVHRFWVFSDLQQSDPENAWRCMRTGVDDFLSLRIPVDAVCYLGDSTEGKNLAHLREMADMQVAELAKVDAPICYVMGNHEFDYHRWIDIYPSLTLPMRERVLREGQWRTTASPLDWTLKVDFGDFALVMLSDRCDPADPSWVTSHCGIRAISTANHGPHDFDADIRALRRELAAVRTPFFTMSHYSFPGGNRDGEGDLQSRLLPLPDNAIAHFYGHSHIGDEVWGKKNIYRQVSTIDDSAIAQFDVASLENRRGSAVRSAIVEWYGAMSYGVFFRNHSAHVWEKAVVENGRMEIKR